MYNKTVGQGKYISCSSATKLETYFFLIVLASLSYNAAKKQSKFLSFNVGIFFFELRFQKIPGSQRDDYYVAL